MPPRRHVCGPRAVTITPTPPWSVDEGSGEFFRDITCSVFAIQALLEFSFETGICAVIGGYVRRWAQVG